VDYDPILNNSNWQWAASTGCDAQPILEYSILGDRQKDLILIVNI
jgi:deoxyribodipyrimidine photolyase